MILVRFPSTRCLANEVSIPFSIRPYRRFPVCCPVTYQVEDFKGHETVWNYSLSGWRFSGNLPLRGGEIFSLTMTLPSDQRVYVLAAIVCWVRGEEYGADTLFMDEQSQEVLEQYLDQKLRDWMECSLVSTDHRTRESMSIEEATVSNMWGIAAIVTVQRHDEKRWFNDLVCRSHRV